MAETHGFAKIDVRGIPDLKTKADLYRHAKTGCQHLSLVNDDENKVFGINFRTPP
jgi:presequence protease